MRQNEASTVDRMEVGWMEREAMISCVRDRCAFPPAPIDVAYAHISRSKRWAWQRM